MPLILMIGKNGELSAAAEACQTQHGWQVVSGIDPADAAGNLGNAIPHVIVTDLWPGRRDAAEFSGLRREFPDAPVLVVSDDEATTVRALRLGASSFVARSQISRDLVTTIQRLLDLSGIEDREVVNPHLRFCRQEFDLPNDADVIASVVRQMRKLAATTGVCGRHDSHRLSIALDEALMNAMVHGNLEVDSESRAVDEKVYRRAIQNRRQIHPYCDRRLSLTVDVTPDAAEFLVTDEGPGFAPDNVPDPTLPENLEKPYGRGLTLMKVFMDEVRFNEQGNQVTLVKRRIYSPAPATVVAVSSGTIHAS